MNVSTKMFTDTLCTFSSCFCADSFDSTGKLLIIVEDFACRGYIHRFEGLGTALTVCFKFGYGIYFVAEKLNSHRTGCLHRKNIDNRTSYGKLRSSLDLFAALIAAV